MRSFNVNVSDSLLFFLGDLPPDGWTGVVATTSFSSDGGSMGEETGGAGEGDDEEEWMILMHDYDNYS